MKGCNKVLLLLQKWNVSLHKEAVDCVVEGFTFAVLVYPHVEEREQAVKRRTSKNKFTESLVESKMS